jgi:hypothetical protein
MPNVIPRTMHLVMEARYKPTLALYGAMDRIGMDLASGYPDWERSALSLEIRNTKQQRRAIFIHRRANYEAVAFPNEMTEFQEAQAIFNRIYADLGSPRVERIGIRQWAVVALTEEFETAVRRLRGYPGSLDSVS